MQFVIVVVFDVWYVLFLVSLEPFDRFEKCAWVVVVCWVLKVYGLYNLVPSVCFEFSVFFGNFLSNIPENVSVVLCGAVMFNVVVDSFVLLLEEFDVVCWSDARGVAVFEDRNVIVCSSVDFGGPVGK